MIKIFLVLFILISTSVFAQNHDSFIIKFKSDANLGKYNYSIQEGDLISIFNVDKNKVKERINSIGQEQLKDLSRYFITDNHSLVQELFSNGEAETITPNYKYKIEEFDLPTDPYYQQQWALDQINAEEAWKHATGKGIIIGLVDTGIDYLNPDFEHQLWINITEDINQNGRFDPWSSEIEIDGVKGDLNGIDDDGNGAVDDIIGYDFVDQTTANLGDSRNPDWDPFDEGDHGTSVAAIMSAAKNDIGIVGLAFNSKIMTLRAFDVTGDGESDDVAKAIVYAALNGADIINMSFGETIKSPIMEDAIKFAYSQGCFLAASSGNSNSDEPHYPSGYKEVCSVGGSSKEGLKYGDSNWGSMLDLIAPGRLVIVPDSRGEFDEKNGTSLSAPYVSAAAALMKEKFPQIKMSEITSTFKASAFDIGTIGWDEKNGSGILDVSKAINTKGFSNITITSPLNESLIFSNRQNEIVIIGSIITPLFDSCHVLIGEGLTPNYFEQVYETITNQILNDTIAFISTKGLIDNVHTVSLKIFLKNKSTIEERLYLNIRSSINALQLHDARVLTAIDENRRSAIVSAITNYPSNFRVKYRKKNSSDDWKIIHEIDNFDIYHYIRIIDIDPNVEYELKAEAYTTEDEIKTKLLSIILPDDNFSNDAFSLKDYSLPMSYILNSVKDINNDGFPELAVNDLSTLEIGPTRIYQFKDNNFTLLDSNSAGWIPIGFGDSNGDQVFELFSTRNADVLLSQYDSGNSIFEQELFTDEIGNVFWGTNFSDIDMDGREEIIAYSDSAYFAYTYQNGQYVFLDVTDLPDNLKRKAPDKAAAVGDFDNDGKIELCFTNIYGNLFMYEFANNKFRLDFVDSVNNSLSNQYMCTVDIEGDGVDEILTASYGTFALYDKETFSNQIWNFRLYKSFAKDSLRLIWQDHALGVQAGIVPRLKLSYKNGIASGELDGKIGDEIILAVFPDLYVLTWNDTEQTMKPVWWFGSTYSNSAVVYDFDGNGKNELGFNTYNGTLFFEMNDIGKKPLLPTGIIGRVINKNSVDISWNLVNDADYYEIYKLVRNGEDILAERYFVSTEDKAIIDTLSPNTLYEFVLRTYDENTNDQYSDFSDIIELFTHDPYEPIAVITENTKYPMILYDGDISGGKFQSHNFEIIDNEGNPVPISNVLEKDNNSLILVLDKQLLPGVYNIYISSFADRYGLMTLSSNYEFNILDDTEESLYLKNLNIVDGTSIIKLQFSEPVDSTALELDNYEIKPFGSMLIANFDPFDNSIVSFFPDDLLRTNSRGVNFTITARNIFSVTGIPITTGAGNTLGFVLSAKSLNKMYIYPSPVELSKHDGITFANLTNNATIQIFKLNGEYIAELRENDGNGGIYWNLSDLNGIKIEPGIYLYKATGFNTQGISIESDVFKFLVKP